MQVTRPADMTTEEATAADKLREEFFSADNKNRLQEKMDTRLKQLEKSGEALVRRVGVEGHQIPSIVERLVQGILGAHNKGQRRRMKSEAIKLIESL